MLKQPKAEPQWEAMAENLNGFGEPFQCGPVVFHPGEWTNVTPGMAQRLQLFAWAQVRRRDS